MKILHKLNGDRLHGDYPLYEYAHKWDIRSKRIIV